MLITATPKLPQLLAQRLLYATLLVVALILHCPAQDVQYQFNLVEGRDGITLGKITAMCQDTRGYMWFCDQTRNSIVRYDGYRMLRYKHDPANPNSLAEGSLETMYADKQGKIWIGFGDMGLDQFDPQTGQFTHYLHQKNNPSSLIDNEVHVMLRDQEGYLWVGTAKGLDRLDVKTGKFIHFQHNPNDVKSLSENIVKALYEDRKGELWVGTGMPFTQDSKGGLNRMNKKNGTFTRYLHDPKNPHSLINNKVRAIFEDRRGTFWIGTSGDGLHTMDRATGRFERHQYDPAQPQKLSRPALTGDWLDHITFIQEDWTGVIWIGTMECGINTYDPIKKKVTHYSASNGFPDQSTWSAFSSRDGVLWLTTQEETLYWIDPFRKNNFHINTGGYRGTFFHEDRRGNIWMGTDKVGLLQIRSKNLKDQKKIQLPLQQDLVGTTAGVRTICEDREGILWLGTATGIFQYNPLNQQLTRFIHDPNNPFKDAHFKDMAASIIQDREGLMWIASPSGLTQYNPQTRQLKHYRNDPGNPLSINSNFTTRLLEDKEGYIWVGTINQGLNRLDKRSGHFKSYPLKHFISALYLDHAGVLWVCTRQGLFYFDKKSDQLRLFTASQSALEEVQINNIVEDEQNNLWVSCYSALFRLNPKRDEALIYGKKHGINHNTLTEGVYKTRRGEILIGDDNGFYAFPPNGVNSHLKTPELLITDFSIDNVRIQPGPGSPLRQAIEGTSNLKLAYTQNNFSFNFSALHYNDPEQNSHFSRLENYDNTWRKAGDEKTASYFKVPPGNYIFRVKVFTSDGAHADKAINITIAPPWWLSIYAYAGYGLILLTVLLLLVRLQRQRIIRTERERTQKKELEQAKEIEIAYTQLKATQTQLIQSEKLASLGELTAGIAHEIQNPLNFVNNFAEVSAEMLEEMEGELHKGDTTEAMAIATDLKLNLTKINHHGKRAAAIVKGMLEHSRSSTGIKEPTDLNILAEEYLRLAYHGFRTKDNGFHCKIETEWDTDLPKVAIIPQDIGRVLLNLTNNALFAVSEKAKQGLGGYEPMVRVSTRRLSETQVELNVEDNGDGIPETIREKIFQPFFTTKPTGQGTGLGLSLAYDIITKGHLGSIEMESQHGMGTTIIIRLPIA